MKNGIESLRAAVMVDTEKYENCFNENGCDHEFYRTVPETNPRLIAMGMTEYCRVVSKCSHKYCDKYKWVIERAKYYAQKTGVPYEEIIEAWEENRSYWYMNYYQDCNQPLKGRKRDDEWIKLTTERICVAKKELETWEFLASGLTLEHQKSVKNDLLNKVENLKDEIKNWQSRMKLHEISCFES
jgi:hypothetical protein